MDGVSFSEPPPSKDWNETVEATKTKLKATSEIVGAKLHIFGNQVKEQSSTASVVISEKTANLKQKIIEK